MTEQTTRQKVSWTIGAVLIFIYTPDPRGVDRHRCRSSRRATCRTSSSSRTNWSTTNYETVFDTTSVHLGTAQLDRDRD